MSSANANKNTYILGISCFYHDSAACLLRDGEIVAAAQEERFTRKKHDASFPKNAINYCLKEAGVTSADVSYLAFYEKPIVKFDRILQTSIAYAPRGIKIFLKAMPIWLKERLWMHPVVKKELPGFNGELIFPTHHESHASSAFFPSPFEDAAVITLDAVGEWNTTTYGVGEKNNITLLKSIDFPHSLGMLYSAFTYYCGFKVNSGEYKLMGLAPYGTPRFADLIKEKLITIRDDGSFSLSMEYFNYGSGLTMTSEKFHELFGMSPRLPETPLEQPHMDLAASIQKVTEEIVVKIARHVQKETRKKNLCLAGGVALNCVANGRLEREGIFDNIWIQPASGDAGGALGAALFAHYKHLGNERVPALPDAMHGAYLGPSYDDEEIETVLKNKRSHLSYEKLDEDALLRKTSECIASGNVVGWFQGRMEYGPRALGARSILGDPRSREMQRTMNLKIKFRESFRPFAPSILEERSGEYFTGASKSPYMLSTYYVGEAHRKHSDSKAVGLEKLSDIRSDIPAVTHVDYSARVQTVSKDTNQRYHKLLSIWEKQTDCPLLVNTSFNVRGEPIVCTPEDAIRCFEYTDMDHLAVGNFLVKKTKRKDEEEMLARTSQFEAD